MLTPRRPRSVDMAAFLSSILEDNSGVDPVMFVVVPPENPHCAHLALSGVSHIEFGQQAKPFPKHWGEPPNTQLKVHNGIMRALPGGYGKVRTSRGCSCGENGLGSTHRTRTHLSPDPSYQPLSC